MLLTWVKLLKFMNILNKIVFGTMSISDKNNSVNLLEYALKNFNTFHLSSEYKSFKKISKIFKEKKKLI